MLGQSGDQTEGATRLACRNNCGPLLTHPSCEQVTIETVDNGENTQSSICPVFVLICITSLFTT